MINMTKNKGGRPKIEINYSLVEKLAHIQCTQEEIAEVLGVSTRTLLRNKEFCHIYKKGLESGKSSLRRLQFKSAEAGNATMQIWLGKQYLGQKDKQEHEHTGKGGKAIEIDISNLSTERLKEIAAGSVTGIST